MELADELTDSDLKKMKHLLTGMNGSGKGILEVIKDPLDLFQHLRQRGILTSDNITYLQAMLWHTKRKDLHNKFVKFAKQRQNVVHFYAPKEKPENGFEYIKFHIAGREKMNRNKLEELRMHVSHALCVPVEFVVASGIEATNSILVTFMVPDGYACHALELSSKDKEYLGSRGVDAIWYQGSLISCIDIDSYITEDNLMKDEEVKILLDQKSKLEEETEVLQVEVLNLQKTVRQQQQMNGDIAQKAKQFILNATDCLIQQYLDVKFKPDNLSLQEIASSNALKYFNHMLKKVENSGYDADLIRHLLEANQLVALSRNRSCNQWIQKQQQNIINKLKGDVTCLQYENDKLKFFLRAGISNPVLSEREEFFLHNVLSNFPHPSMMRTETQVSVEVEEPVDPENHLKILHEIFRIWEGTLTAKDKKILEEKFISNEREKKKFVESKMPLLMYLWVKHSKEKPGLSFDTWKVQILSAIRRIDLAQEWTEKSDMVVHLFTNPPEKNNQDLPNRTPQTRHRQRQTQKRRRAENILPNANPIQDDGSSDRIQRIEMMVHDNLKLTQSLVNGVFEQSRTPSFQHKNEFDVLFDNMQTFQPRQFETV